MTNLVSEQSILEYLEKPRYHLRAQLKANEMEQQLSELMTTMATIQKQNDAIKVSIGAIEEIKPMVVELVGWKPAVEKAMTELREEMGDLRAQVHQLAKGTTPEVKADERPASSSTPPNIKPDELPTLLPTLPGPKLKKMKEEERSIPQECGEESHGLFSHRVDLNHRGKAVWGNPSSQFLPVKGAFNSFSPTNYVHEFGGNSRGGVWGIQNTASRVECPVFDGGNPKAWKLKCETYFGLCGTHSDHWIGVAILQFTSAALTWLQSTHAHEVSGSWEEFAAWVCGKFGREEF